MNDGYRPHASYITKTLILTFTMGVAVGIAIGWGAKSSWQGAPESLEVATPTTETPAPEDSVPAPPAEPVETAAVETPPAETAPSGPFDPDVTGFWPAAHLFVGISGTKADVATLELLNEFKPGGVVLGPDNVVDSIQLSALILQIKQAVGLGTTLADPPVILYADDRQALPHLMGEKTVLAADGTLGPEALQAVVDQARAARDHGIGAVLAPSLDIRVPTTAPAVAMRSMGDDVDRVSERGLDVAGRMRGAGVSPVALLFPGGGLAVTDDTGLLHIPAAQMDGLAEAMRPFKAAMDAGIPAILVGHMAVPGIDTDRPNRPAALSPRLLQVLVREEWGYTGVLLADDITGHPMTRDLPRDEIALKALVSGCDAVILRLATRSDLRQICDTYVRLSARSDFPADAIQESKARLRAWRAQMGRATPPATPAETMPPIEVATKTSTDTVTTPVTVPPVGKAPAEEAPATDDATEIAKLDTTVAKAMEAAPAPVSATAPEVAETPSDPAEKPTGKPSEKPGTTPPSADTDVAQVEPVEPPSDVSDPGSGDAAPGDKLVTPPVPPTDAVAEHTIQRGDSLIALARKYNVTTDQLKAWNNLKDENIKYGRKLRVQPPAGDGIPKDDKAPKATGDAPADSPAPAVVAEEAPAVETPPEPAKKADTSGAEEVDAAAADVAKQDSTPAPKPAPAKKPEAAPQPENTDRRTHVVAAGETPDLIALGYGVDVADLRAWNALSADVVDLETGRSIVVYLPFAEPSADDESKDELAPTTGAKSETLAAEAESAPPAAEAKPKGPAPGTYEVYEVSPGDNLRRIAQRFGTTQELLIEWNNIKEPDHVQLGWKLKVPKQSAAQDSGMIGRSEPPETLPASE